MNKLGFYVSNFGADGVFDAIKNIRPPVLLTELNDKSMLERIRNDLSPDTFVIGRFFYTPGQQNHILDHENPVDFGVKLAERCLNYEYGFGKQRGTNGNLYINAWMTLNEAVPGPNSSAGQHEGSPEHEEMLKRAAAFDRLQVAFLERLKEEDEEIEAVAFNFGAGNYSTAQHYIDHYPNTVHAYIYLGFHEYGWPHMDRSHTGAKSACGDYRQVMTALRHQYGNKHKAIITETGLALMYKYSKHQAGDKGWLYRNQPQFPPIEQITEEDYRDSLRWYNQLLVEDDAFVLGACLFQVGPGNDWVTFSHTSKTPEGNPITLMDFVYGLHGL